MKMPTFLHIVTYRKSYYFAKSEILAWIKINYKFVREHLFFKHYICGLYTAKGEHSYL